MELSKGFVGLVWLASLDVHSFFSLSLWPGALGNHVLPGPKTLRLLLTAGNYELVIILSPSRARPTWEHVR